MPCTVSVQGIFCFQRKSRRNPLRLSRSRSWESAAPICFSTVLTLMLSRSAISRFSGLSCGSTGTPGGTARKVPKCSSRSPRSTAITGTPLRYGRRQAYEYRHPTRPVRIPPRHFWSAANLWHDSSRRQTAEAAAAGRSPPPPAVPTRQERHPARCLPTPCGHGPSEKPVHTRVHSDRGIVAENTPNGFPQFSQNMSEYSESFKYSDNSGNCKIWTAANYLRLRVDSTPQGILSPLRGAQAQKRQDRSCGSCL